MKLKTFKITTFGCRVNQAESREIGEQLVKSLNLQPAELYNQADLIIINTCVVTNKAEKEVRQEIRKAKKQNPDSFLVITGCWADKINKNKKRTENNNLYKNKTNNLQPQINLLIINKDKKNITQLLKKKIKKQNNKTIKKQYQDKYALSKKAIIKIQTGCNNFCSYCIVPYVRGRSKSYPAKEIIKEIKEKEKQGIKEIILTGIDISDYKPSLIQLIKAILKQTRVEKISFGSINLKSFNKDFLNLYPNKRLTTNFHIPLQSGSNQTLKRMNRKYTKKQFIKTIKKIKNKIKEFTFSTDLIVGFPGETEKEFKQTVKTIKTLLKNNLIKVHIFRYSRKTGTLADKMKKKWGKVDEGQKKLRAAYIQNLIKDSLF